MNSTLDLHFTTEPGRPSVLAHLPWELLHDENGFLIQRGILPVRRISFGSQARDTERKQPANLPLNVPFMTCSPRHVRPVLASKKLGETVLSYDPLEVFHLTRLMQNG